MSTSNPSPVAVEAALRRAKQPRTPLAGPYGHPFHAALITVPIGAWISSFVFDLAGAFGGDPVVFGRGALWLIGVGIAGALLAALFGLIDLSSLESGTRVRKLALTHMSLNLVVVALFVVSFVLRMTGGYEAVNVGGLVVSVVALLILAFSGYLGGELAYHFGVRVAEEGVQRQGFTTTAP